MANNVWLLTWTTCGTWLPGDNRGLWATSARSNPLTRVSGSTTHRDPTTQVEPTKLIEPTTQVVGFPRPSYCPW